MEQAEKTIRNRVDKWGVTEPDIKRKQQQPDPDPAPRLQGPGEGQGAARPHRPARVQDRRRRVDGARRASARSCRPARRTRAASRCRSPRAAAGRWRAWSCPAGHPAQATYVAASTRAELDAAIEQGRQAPAPAATRRSASARCTVGTGVVKERYYRTYLLHAKTELTGDYISDARAAMDNSQGAGAPGGDLLDVARGRAAHGEAHHRRTSAAAWPSCSTPRSRPPRTSRARSPPTARSRWAPAGTTRRCSRRRTTSRWC